VCLHAACLGFEGSLRKGLLDNLIFFSCPNLFLSGFGRFYLERRCWQLNIGACFIEGEAALLPSHLMPSVFYKSGGQRQRRRHRVGGWLACCVDRRGRADLKSLVRWLSMLQCSRLWGVYLGCF
jgi:hypothetical protein